jgi:hypothetical protein
MGGTGGNLPTPEQVDQELAKVQFMSTGPDSVSLSAPGQQQPIPLKKVEGKWKVDLTQLMKNPQMAAMAPMMAAMFKPMAANINTIAADVEAGKYNSVQEVQAALQKVNPFGGMAPPGARPGAAPGATPAAAPGGVTPGATPPPEGAGGP